MKMNVKKFANKKIVTCVALIAAATTTAMAQGNGLAGINEATSMVTSYFEPGTKLIYAIGAVVGLLFSALGHPNLFVPPTYYQSA